jgi:hypothetical protein
LHKQNIFAGYYRKLREKREKNGNDGQYEKDGA